ncbi:hypothetical protein OA511_04790 [Prochlorococcus sp. AH-716-J09]|nr:hypothetical protein [Prochlorococcus sp. AH-716-J09]
MIYISRCPLRLSLLGGTSDLDWFVNDNGRGFTIGCSIALYSRVITSFSSRSDSGILNYSSREIYHDVDNITHPIIRETLKALEIKKTIELCSFGEKESGQGLGSSSSFTVALLSSLSKLTGKSFSNIELAHLASEVEITRLNYPIGRQDQYHCALGGVNFIEFRKNGRIKSHLYQNIASGIRKYLNDSYLLNLGIKRSASTTLQKLKDSNESHKRIQGILEDTDSFIDHAKNASINDIELFLEESLTKTWNKKKALTGVYNEKLSNAEKFIQKCNFKILKLIGAGGGGYFLIKYKGKNFEKDRGMLEEANLYLQKIILDEEGCVSCEI